MGIFNKEEKKPVAKKKKVAAEAVEKTAPATAQASASHGSLSVIVKPLVTEKAAHLQSENKYAFVVDRAANKQQIALAVKELYGVEVLGVHVVNVQGHRVRFGKGMGKRSDFKKAIVTLPAGSAITMHAGV